MQTEPIIALWLREDGRGSDAAEMTIRRLCEDDGWLAAGLGRPAAPLVPDVLVPDVILMDIRCVASAIAEIPALRGLCPRAAIALIAPATDTDTLALALEAGADEVLTYAMDPEERVARMRRLGVRQPLPLPLALADRVCLN